MNAATCQYCAKQGKFILIVRNVTWEWGPKMTAGEAYAGKLCDLFQCKECGGVTGALRDQWDKHWEEPPSTGVVFLLASGVPIHPDTFRPETTPEDGFKEIVAVLMNHLTSIDEKKIETVFDQEMAKHLAGHWVVPPEVRHQALKEALKWRREVLAALRMKLVSADEGEEK